MAKPAYRLGEGITTAARPTPYRPQSRANPCIASLRVYTQDPGVSRFDGAIAELAVAWEPAGPGPSGALFVVRDVSRANR